MGRTKSSVRAKRAAIEVARSEQKKQRKKARDEQLEHHLNQKLELEDALAQRDRYVELLEQKVIELERKVRELEQVASAKDVELEKERGDKAYLKGKNALFKQKVENLVDRNRDLNDANHKSQHDFVKAQLESLKHAAKKKKANEAKVKTLETIIRKLVEESPTGGAKLKKFGRNLKQQTKNVRCQKLLECIRKSVGDDVFDEFISEFCRYVARSRECSFKLGLSELDSFLATVKWKLSDGFLKDFKAFLRSKLGFDIFQSREKIHLLRNKFSNLDQYEISVNTVVRKAGERQVEVDTAIIRATDLHSLLRTRLERLHENGRLRLKNPDDVITLGVGGDKGGAHTKLVIAIGNVDTPNNPHGLLLIGMYQGSDDYDSLKKFMSPVFHLVNNLKSVTYTENGTEVTREIQKYALGDCKFLSSILGHSGQSCSTPCFICALAWTNKGKNASQLETFDFSKVGRPYRPDELKTPLIEANSAAVAPPEVHSILGVAQSYIVDWLISLCNKLDSTTDLPESLKSQRKYRQSLQEEFEFFKSRCSALNSSYDIVVALIEVTEKCAKSGIKTFAHIKPCASSFCAISSTKKQIFGKAELFYCLGCHRHVHSVCALLVNPDEELQPDARCLECRKQKTNISLDDRLQILNGMRANLLQKIDDDLDYLVDVEADIENITVDALVGPTRQKFETVLKSIGCDLRTWYQQLTGNQVRRLLRPENIRKILDVFPLNSSPNLPYMEQAMMSLGKIMSSGDNKEKTDSEIDELETVLDTFLYNLKQAQPKSTVTPKMHLLLSHLIPFLRIHRSWGHITEQGLEHLHAIVNSLNVRLASTLDPTKKAKLIIKSLSNFNYIFDVGQSWYTSH